MKLINLKAKSKNFFIKLALIILLGTFAFGGIANLFFAPDDYVVKINKEKFSANEFNAFKMHEIKAIEEQLGTDRFNSLNKTGINNIILSKFIDQKLITQLADDLAISANDNLVKWWVVNSGFFADKDKKFSKEKYFELLKAQNLSEKDFLKSIREYLKRKTVIDVINNLDFENQLLKQQEEIHRNSEVNFDILQVKVNAQDFIVSQEEIAEFYKQKKEQFLKPETRDITYLTISVNDLIKDVEVTDNEALVEYNNNLDKDFHLLEFSNELEARNYSLSASLLAKNPAKQIKLLKLNNEDLDDTQAKIALSLSKENDLSKPFLMNGIWYILQAEYKKNAPTFAEVKKEIKENIAKTQARNLLSKKEHEVRDSELLQTISLEEIAKNYGWKIGKITNICNSCAEINKQYQELAEKFNNMAEAVFDNDIGKNSGLNEALGDDFALLSVRVDKITEANFIPLEEVRSQIEAELIVEKQDNYLIEKNLKFQENFKNNITNITSIKEWLNSNKLNVNYEKDITSRRFEYIHNNAEKTYLNAGILKTAFATMPSSSNWYYDNEKNSHVIVFVNKLYENKNLTSTQNNNIAAKNTYEELIIYLSKIYNVKVANVASQEN